MKLFFTRSAATFIILPLLALFVAVSTSAPVEEQEGQPDPNECFRYKKEDFDAYPKVGPVELFPSQMGVFTGHDEWRVTQTNFTQQGRLKVEKGNGGSNDYHFFQLNFIPALQKPPHFYLIQSNRWCIKPQYILTDIEKVFTWEYAPSK